jgi:hypothetical protein
MPKKSYKKFLKKGDPNVGLDKPLSPIKVGESSGSSNEPKDTTSTHLLSQKQTVATVGPMASTAKGVGRSNISRASFVTNQITSDEAKRIYKSMDDVVQKEYSIHGIDICVEWPAGIPRKYGKDNEFEGKTSYCDYGYFKGTKSADGGGIDVYVGPQHESKNVYLLLQKPTKWDVEHGISEPEQKYMLGFGSIDDAEAGYKASMPEEWFMSIGEVIFMDFLEVIKTAMVEKSVDTEEDWFLLNQGQTEKWSLSKSNNASADWRTGFKQTQSELLKYIEGEQSATANQQTDHTAEFSPEPETITKGKTPRYIKRMDLAKRLMEKTPRPTSEGIMSRESERKYNRTPLVRHTRLVDAGQTSAIPLFPNRLSTTKKKNMMKSLLSPIVDGDNEVKIVFKL